MCAEEDQDYIDTIRTLLKRHGRQQLESTTSRGGSVRDFATAGTLPKTLEAFWKSEAYGGDEATKEAAESFMKSGRETGGTLLHDICDFYHDVTREDKFAGQRFDAFKMLHQIAKKHGLLGKVDSQGNTFLHKLCISIRSFGNNHPIFQFVLENYENFSWLATNNDGGIPMAYLCMADDKISVTYKPYAWAALGFSPGPYYTNERCAPPEVQLDLIYSVLRPDPTIHVNAGVGSARVGEGGNMPPTNHPGHQQSDAAGNNETSEDHVGVGGARVGEGGREPPTNDPGHQQSDASGNNETSEDHVGGDIAGSGDSAGEDREHHIKKRSETQFCGEMDPHKKPKRSEN